MWWEPGRKKQEVSTKKKNASAGLKLSCNIVSYNHKCVGTDVQSKISYDLFWAVKFEYTQLQSAWFLFGVNQCTACTMGVRWAWK